MPILNILRLDGGSNNTRGTEPVGSLVVNGLSQTCYEIVLASMSCGEDEDRYSLSQVIIKKNLSDSVELVGNTDNVEQYYKSATVFCLNSRFEGFPMVLLETLSFGLPVVSFDCDTGPAEILDGTGSILVKPYDKDLLADGLNTLIADVDLRESISVASKEKAQQYQSDEIIKSWTTLLENI